MKTTQLIILLVTASIGGQAQMEVFEPLLDKVWSAQGTWGDGSKFRQDISFAYGLDSTVILTNSMGYVDEEQTQYGERNHGLRRMDVPSGKMLFWEFDVFGGLTTGEVTTVGRDIYYHYEYGGSLVTDAWLYQSDDEYRFVVGSYVDGKWNAKYLETTMYGITKRNTDYHLDADGNPYYEIPDAPEHYTAATSVARMIDGLGFRYYWATEGLRPEDLSYRPSETSRTSAETLDHLYGLCEVVYNTAAGKDNIRPLEISGLSWEEKRKATLYFLMEASDILRSNPDLNLEGLEIVFSRGDRRSSFPFWHQLNGPLADALWHTGQIVSQRRASGNPLPSGVSVFMGTKRD